MNLQRLLAPALWLPVVALCATGIGYAQSASAKKNPASKVYFTDVKGEAQIDTGDKIEDVAQRSVYTAEGTVIETKRPQTEDDQAKYYSTMVYSNGTGAFFDNDTRVEVKRFVQEPFVPNRSDIEVEPSISQTQAFVSRGTVGLCTSKLVAGSSMNYQTPLGSINVRGRRVVIEAARDVTKISMLEGNSTVKGGSMDMGGHTVYAGQQAIIRPGIAGQPNRVEITQIPPQELPKLDEKVAIACAAKKTVYFEVKERQISESVAASDAADVLADQAAGASTDGNATGTGADPTPVTAFDGNSASPGFSPNGSLQVTTVREIVPVPVVPIVLPVQYTVSPATLSSPPATNPGG
jgi:hypothetical protein